MDIFFDSIGTLGVFFILAAYFFIQTEVLSTQRLSYQWLNLTGAFLIILSLLHTWNLPAFLMEASWFLVSVYGIINVVKHKAEK